MYCNQCPEVLSGKGCTKNGPCKRQRLEPQGTERQDKEDSLSLATRLKGMMRVFRKKQ